MDQATPFKLPTPGYNGDEYLKELTKNVIIAWRTLSEEERQAISTRWEQEDEKDQMNRGG